MRGPINQQNGVYQLNKDSNPYFFKHWKRDFLVYRKDGGWALGRMWLKSISRVRMVSASLNLGGSKRVGLSI